MKDFFKSFGCKVLGVVALILVGVMIYGASTGGLATIPATITGAIITPLQTAVSAVSDGISSFFGQFGSSQADRDRIAALEQENNELWQKQADYDQLKQQNEWYAKILGLHEQHTDYTFAAGRKIAEDPAGKYGNFTINAGSTSGIEAGDPVITAEGLVGVDYEVGFTYSKVRTILDPDTNASAAISRNGDTGYTGGSPSLASQGKLRLHTLDRDSGAAVGDLIVTSGSGGVYPSGLLIGKIEQVTPESDGITLSATVTPFVNMGTIRDVMVITSFDGQGEGTE